MLFAQTDYRLMELTINEEDNLEKIEFDDMGFLSLCKPDFINRFLYFNGNYNALKAIEPIDTSYCSPYGFEIKIYKSNYYNDYVIIWEALAEYTSDISLFYITESKIYRICDLPIQTICDNCDGMNYPTDQIVISGDKEYIKINFLQAVNYNIGNGRWQVFATR